MVTVAQPFITKTWQVAVLQKRAKMGWRELPCISDFQDAGKEPGFLAPYPD